MNDQDEPFIVPDDIWDDDGCSETELLDDDDIRILTYLEDELDSESE